MEHISPIDLPRPAVAVDLVIYTILNDTLKILLIQRGIPPYQGAWALPGGFVRVGDGVRDQGEGIEEAAHRELAEETGLPVGSVFLEQLQAFGTPQRDPRMRVISIAWYALIRPDLAPTVVAGSDASDAQWHDALHAPTMAFDHSAIAALALQRIQERIRTTRIARELVPPTFTIAELRRTYEIVHNVRYDHGNFRRRITKMISRGIIEKATEKRQTRSKPAQTYRFTHPSR